MGLRGAIGRQPLNVPLVPSISLMCPDVPGGTQVTIVSLFSLFESPLRLAFTTSDSGQQFTFLSISMLNVAALVIFSLKARFYHRHVI